MHAAATGGHTETVQALIANTGVEVNATNKYVHTPLHTAAFHGHTKTVQVLIDAKADIHAKDIDQQTPLMYAAAKGYSKILKILLKAGALINIKDKNKALDFAKINGHLSAVNIFKNYTLKETPARICAPKQESATRTTKPSEVTDADKESEQLKYKHF